MPDRPGALDDSVGVGGGVDTANGVPGEQARIVA